MNTRSTDRYLSNVGWGALAVTAVGLWLTVQLNFLLFHTIAELFAVVVAVLMAVTGWYTYPFSRNNFLLYLAGGYLWIGAIDLAHTLAYRGLEVFPGDLGNVAAQYWVGARYLEALVLLSAPLLARRRLERTSVYAAFGLATVALNLAILTGHFPTAFVPDSGLTAFKVLSEYAVIGMLFAALGVLWWRRRDLDARIVQLMALSITATIASEFMFTLYTSVYGVESLLGHILKLTSFWIIFIAIVRTTLTEPFRILTQGATTYDAVPDAIVVVDRRGIVRHANRAARDMVGAGTPVLVGRHCHELFHAGGADAADCAVCRAIERGVDSEAVFELRFGDGAWHQVVLSPVAWMEGQAGLVHISRDVTERRQAEEALRSSEQRFRNLVEATSDWVWEVNAEGRYTYVSPRVFDILGYRPEMLLGKTPFDLMPAEEAERVAGLFAAARDGLGPLTALENVNRHRDGHEVVIETSGLPFYDELGRFAGYRGIDRDISERKRSEQALARSHEELSSILLSMSDGVFGMDVQGNATFVNPALEAITGWRAEEFIGRCTHEAIHHTLPDGSPYPQQSCPVWQTVSARQPHWDEEDLFWRKDGSAFPVEYSSSPLRDKDGDVVGAVVVFRDISHRKQVERALLESERRYRAIMENASDAIVLVAADGRLVDANRQTEHLLGYSRDELLRLSSLKEVVAPADHAGFDAALDAVNNQGSSLHEHLLLRKDGSETPVEVAGSRVDLGDERMFVGVLRDISERRRLEQERVQRGEELERTVAERTGELQAVNRELESFSYSVSHDLRAPLRAVNGFSQALLEDYGDLLDDTARRYLFRMQHATNRMGQLIDGLLVLSRVIRSELSIESTDLSALAAEVAAELMVTQPERKVRWAIAAGLEARADPRLLRLLMQNLINNALKFTAVREEAVIEVGLAADEGEPCFFVRDNGVGFEMQYASQLFQPFHRLHSAEEYDGTGIGLATVQRVIRRHGGRCWAEAEPDRGAAIFFTLPPTP